MSDAPDSQVKYPGLKAALTILFGGPLLVYVAPMLVGEGGSGIGNLLTQLMGPPDDVSRDYAKQLLEEQPPRAGEELHVPGAFSRCLNGTGYLRYNIINGYTVTARGQRFFRSARFSFSGAQDTITPANDVLLSNITVTGVRSMTDGSKLIEYSARFNFYGLQGNCVGHLDNLERRAIAQRYDDGWRLLPVTPLSSL